jgi:hypothetical protein
VAGSSQIRRAAAADEFKGKNRIAFAALGAYFEQVIAIQ